LGSVAQDLFSFFLGFQSMSRRNRNLDTKLLKEASGRAQEAGHQACVLGSRHWLGQYSRCCLHHWFTHACASVSGLIEL